MLKNNVPQFVSQMQEMAELFHVEQAELDRMEMQIEKIIKQFYIKSATYALMDWERNLLFRMEQISGWKSAGRVCWQSLIPERQLR